MLDKMLETYNPEFHFSTGLTIQPGLLAEIEACYINLDNPRRCPHCGRESELRETIGPLRTKIHSFKVEANFYLCSSCKQGYVNAPILD